MQNRLSDLEMGAHLKYLDKHFWLYTFDKTQSA